MDYIKRWTQCLQSKIESHAFRKVTTYRPVDAVTVELEGRSYLMMASNNYLGLTHNELVQQSAIDAVQAYGTGSGGARLTSGTFPLFRELESALADFKGTESSLVFNTGYMANVGTITAVADKNTIIFSDELNHASIIDGCRLSGAKIERYKHKDVEHAEYLLKQYKNVPKLIITDGVFSMDGDIAPLDGLCRLKRDYNALLMVDDAHATGVIGKGRGTAHYFGISDVDIQLGTLSKALGSVGGFVAGSQVLIDYLVNYSRSFIFSTALSPADIGTALASLHIINESTELVDRLEANVTYMAASLRRIGIDCDDATPIFPIMIGENERALCMANYLYEKGIILTAIRPPTVPVGESRLRLTVTASHTKEQIDYVVSTLEHALDV